MARARNIKPAFFTNELLGTADPFICLTFAGLWCLADKMGVLEDRPLRIKAELFPYRESLDVNGYLTELARLGFIVRYENEGKRFIQVCNFRKHQSPHNTEKARGFPFPTDPKSLILADNRYCTVNSPCEDGEFTAAKRPDSLIPDSLIPDSGFTDSPHNGAAPVVEKPEKPPKAKPQFDVDDLVRLGVDAQHAKDWIVVRRGKKAVMTVTALNGVIREAEKAGMPLADAIRVCAEKNWVGFEAQWLLNASRSNGGFGAAPNRQQQIEDHNNAVVRELEEREARRSGTLPWPDDVVAVDGEVIDAS